MIEGEVLLHAGNSRVGNIVHDQAANVRNLLEVADTAQTGSGPVPPECTDRLPPSTAFLSVHFYANRYLPPPPPFFAPPTALRSASASWPSALPSLLFESDRTA